MNHRVKFCILAFNNRTLIIASLLHLNSKVLLVHSMNNKLGMTSLEVKETFWLRQQGHKDLGVDTEETVWLLFTKQYYRSLNAFKFLPKQLLLS